MTLNTIANVTATATGIGDLSVVDADIRLDETRSPYCEAVLTINLPDSETIEDLDPYADPPVRVVVTATQTTNGVDATRDFDLLLHQIELDADSATATLTLESDEALLIDAGNVSSTSDDSAETYQDSLRDIIDDALSAATGITNLVANPSAETATTGYSAFAGTSGTSAVTNPTSTTAFGAKVARATWSVASTAAGGAIVYQGLTALPVTAGVTYSFYVGHIKSSINNRLRFRVAWYTSADALIGSVVPDAEFQATAGVVYSKQLENLVAPATAAYASLAVASVAGTGYANWSIGSYLEMDGVLAHRGESLVAYFDGATTDSTYTYSWVGTANASQSIRTAALEAGSEDADFTITTAATNLITHPSAENASLGWVTSTVNAAISRQTTFAKYGTYSFRSQASGTTSGVGIFFGSNTVAPYAIPVTEGKTYTFSYWTYTTLSSKTADPRIRWGNSTVQVGADVSGTPVALTASTWTRVSISGTAPAGATNAAVWANSLGSGNYSSGNQVFYDGVLFTEGSTLEDYFDGATATDDYYSYSWTGTANASTSLRTRLDNRAADILQVKPGDTYWDFLYTLIRTAGLRLFCDENRDWRLVDPATYSVDGFVYVTQAVNALSGVDRRSLQATDTQGNPTWFSGVVIRYRWIGDDGETLEEYDTAGTGRKVWRITIDGPYPGPGAADAILARAAGRGRTQQLKARVNIAATPGMTLVSSLPGIPLQVGVVSAVRWKWSAKSNTHDEMDIRSRGLLETSELAWLLAEGDWDDQVQTWATYDGP